jgi:ABC-type transport system substrate-binding protein
MWKKIVSITLLIGLIFVVFIFSDSAKGLNADKPRYGGVFRLKSFIDKFHPDLDPASPDSYIFVSEQLYDGLVKLDKNLNIIPCLAEYWEISPDGKKYTFYLRKGVRFHNGRELSAEDVKFSLERLLDKETKSPYFQFFLPRVVGAEEFREGKARSVKGLVVLDKHTFEIHWRRPFISALYLLSMHFCKILPHDLAREKGKGFFWKPCGTGPFQFDYWLRTPQLEICGVRLKRNDDYFNGKPYLDAVEFCPFFTLDHFLNNEIDAIPVLSEKLIDSKYQIFQNGSLQYAYLGMSCHIPPLDRRQVRRAIYFGLDKAEIVRAAHDIKILKQVVNGYIPSRLPGFFPSDDEKTYDPQKAKELLKKTGSDSGQDFPTLTLLLESPSSRLKIKIYREIKKQLENIGLKLRLDYYRSSEEIKNYKRPYIVLVEKSLNFPDAEDIIRPLFYSKSVFNLFRYENPELDSLLKQSEVEKSWTRRIKLFHQMEKLLFFDVPAVPLFSRQNRVAMQPYVKGVEVPPLGLYYLDTKDIWVDK